MACTKATLTALLTNQNVVAYLNTIASLEAPAGYYTQVGNTQVIPQGPEHPGTYVPGLSTAFGRYQFIKTTWDGLVKTLGPLDIRNPRDQDIAALCLIDQRGVLNEVINGNCPATLDALAPEWCTIPKRDNTFGCENQSGPLNAAQFCEAVKRNIGTTLPNGPNTTPGGVTPGAPSTSNNQPNNVGAFTSVDCPTISDDDMYSANFQITNPGCKLTGPIAPITGASTNGSTNRAANIVGGAASFSLNAEGKAQCSALRHPMKPGYDFSSPYGLRNGRPHNGVDYATDTGTPVYSAQTGRVAFAGWNEGGYGNMIDIVGGNGIATKYAHLSEINVTEAQDVLVGQQIGRVGDTGASRGPHLHFEVRINGALINPVDCIPEP